jgi:hypothetical protein
MILAETQFIYRALPLPPVDDAHMVALLEDFFIDPISNFAFCGLAKNAVSQWKAVLRNVYENCTTQGFEGPTTSCILQARKSMESNK